MPTDDSIQQVQAWTARYDSAVTAMNQWLAQVGGIQVPPFAAATFSQVVPEYPQVQEAEIAALGQYWADEASHTSQVSVGAGSANAQTSGAWDSGVAAPAFRRRMDETLTALGGLAATQSGLASGAREFATITGNAKSAFWERVQQMLTDYTEGLAAAPTTRGASLLAAATAGQRAVTDVQQQMAKFHNEIAGVRFVDETQPVAGAPDAGPALLGAQLLGADAPLPGSDATDRVGPILGPAEAERAATALAELSAADTRQFNALLGAAGSDLEQAWLQKALAAGNDVTAITEFARTIRGQSAGWLTDRLRPLDPTAGGDAKWMNASLEQTTQKTCGSMSLMVITAMHDPVYALDLATRGSDGDMAAVLAAEEQRILELTTSNWNQEYGTPPWHAASWLATHSGARYDWSLDTTRATELLVTDAVDDAEAGDPTMLLIGPEATLPNVVDGVPMHYLTAIGQDGDSVQLYDPGTGTLKTIPYESLNEEPVTEFGRQDHLWGYVTPRG